MQTKTSKPNICLNFHSIRNRNNSECKYLANKCSSSSGSSTTQINMDKNWRTNSRTIFFHDVWVVPFYILEIQFGCPSQNEKKKKTAKERKTIQKRFTAFSMEHRQISLCILSANGAQTTKGGLGGEQRLGILDIKMSDAAIENFKFLFATPHWQHRIHIHSLVVNRLRIVRCQYIIKTAINSKMSGGGQRWLHHD